MTIKMLVMDVDGTLTDGKIYISSRGGEFKAFNVRDGYGITNILPTIGVIPVIITGRSSDIVIKRAEELGIKEVHQGVKDKLGVLKKICARHSITLKEVAFIGDDCNDIPAMQSAGLSFAPNDCASEVKNIVGHLMTSSGGQGAVRECIECLLKIEEGFR